MINTVKILTLLAFLFLGKPVNSQSLTEKEKANVITINKHFGDSIKIPVYTSDVLGFQESGLYFKKENKKWGLINSNTNKTLIPFKLDSVLSVFHLPNIKSYLIKEKGKWSSISFNKKYKIEDCEPDTGLTKADYRKNGYDIDTSPWKRFLVIFNGKQGIMNKGYKTIVPVEYDYVRDNYLHYNEDNKDEKSYIIYNDDKVGFITNEGTVEPVFDDIGVYFPDFVGDWDNLKPSYKKQDLKLMFLFEDYKIIGVTKDGKKGIVDYTGKQIVPNIYDEMFCAESYVREFGNHFIVVKDGKYGIISHQNEIILPLNYDIIEYFDTSKKGTSHIYLVKQNGKYGLINSLNEVVKPIEYTRKELEN